LNIWRLLGRDLPDDDVVVKEEERQAREPPVVLLWKGTTSCQNKLLWVELGTLRLFFFNSLMLDGDGAEDAHFQSLSFSLCLASSIL